MATGGRSYTSFSVKTPPPFDRNVDDYEKWKKKFTLWQSITDVTNDKQGGLIILRLDDRTQDSIMEAMKTEDINKENGADLVIAQLDTIFQKDKTVTAYEAYEEFETFKRPEGMSMAEYISEFEKKWNKTKAKGTALSDNVLAYRLLKSANLSFTEQKLIKATMDEVTTETMKIKLRKVFSGEVGVSRSMEQLQIKQEPLDEKDTFFGSNFKNRSLRGKNYPPMRNSYQNNQYNYQNMRNRSQYQDSNAKQ